MKLFNLINYTNDNTIIFNKKTFVTNKRYNKYTTKDGLDRIIYKCTNNRKFEHLNKNRKGKSFCNATIIKILEAKNKKQKKGFFLIKNHSQECIDLDSEKLTNKNNNDISENNDAKTFIKKCEMIMSNSNIFDRKLFKNEFISEYNKCNYNFPINNNFLVNIITKWKNSTNKFTKYCIFDNQHDYRNNLILRDYRAFYSPPKGKKL